MHWHITISRRLVVQSILTWETRWLMCFYHTPILTDTPWSWWTEIHNNGYWLLIMNLVSASRAMPHWRITLTLIHFVLLILNIILLLLLSVLHILLLILVLFSHHILSSTNASSIANISISLNIITEFKTTTIRILAVSVSIDLILVWWTWIGHGDVALSLDSSPNWRHIVSHGCICVWPSAIITGVEIFVVSMRSGLHGIILLLVLAILIKTRRAFVDSAKSSVNSILCMPCYCSLDLTFVGICGSESFGVVVVLFISSIMRGVNFLTFSPPLWINHRIQTSGARSLFSTLMWVVNLKSSLRTISWHLARRLFVSLDSPGWRRFLHDFNCLEFFLNLIFRILRYFLLDIIILIDWIAGLLDLSTLFMFRMLLTGALVRVAGRVIALPLHFYMTFRFLDAGGSNFEA